MRRALRILRNIALLLIAAAIVLAAVLVANTWRKSSQQIAVTPVAPVAVDDSAAAQRLGEAVKLQTIASASDALLAQLESFLWRGPPHARVDAVEVVNVDVVVLPGFRIG